MAGKKVFCLEDARREKALEQKEEKLMAMAQRFENALPIKATPVKDFLKAKKKKKNKGKK